MGGADPAPGIPLAAVPCLGEEESEAATLVQDLPRQCQRDMDKHFGSLGRMVTYVHLWCVVHVPTRPS